MHMKVPSPYDVHTLMNKHFYSWHGHNDAKTFEATIKYLQAGIVDAQHLQN